ncbi:ABC transporter ATP-binding protein [Candidatus Thalassarchaeum betae]|uniref:ABC transporter ATP-binding protein n=1 Tax=Candidatus Thalassarchaeum betae TaxID=2599289 RepID=UPI0030C68E65|nr:ABC transporter ATP-binding protein [Candidatus Thalassoarchaea betae]
MLQVSDLRKGFDSGRRRLEVLKGIDLEIQPGELVAMMGPSGCGKSTLLNIIGGLLEADSGSISLGEFSYGTKPPSRVVNVRRRGVGWIFQDYHLIDRLSALDNVIFALELSGVPTPQAKEQAREALEKVGLEDRMEFIPDQLSGGQRQRVAIARAIAGSRPLLLADEPTGNLDVKSGQEIIDLFKQLCKEDGTSVLMVTHDPTLASMADRMLLLKDGITAASDIRSAWGADAGVGQ